MKAYLIQLIILSTIPLFLFGQNEIKKNVTISGVIESVKGEPIPDAHVYNAVSNSYAISNRDGSFFIRVPENIESLTFSHLSYEPKEIKLTAKSFSVNLKIVLNPKINLIDNIDISATNIELIVDKDFIWVYDYELTNENKILLLLRDSSKHELRLIDQNKNVLDDRILTYRGNLNLIRDGLNNVYLKSPDSIYQYYEKGKRIYLNNGYPMKDYQAFIYPCVHSTKDNFYFREYLNNNQLLRYFYINRFSRKKEILVDVFDMENYKTLVHSRKTQMRHSGVNYMGNIGLSDLHTARSFLQWEMYNTKILSKPIYSPLIGFRDSIYVFDFINSSLIVFNNGNEFQRQLPLLGNKSKKGIQVILDEINGTFYYSWNKNGISKFCKFDIYTGKISDYYTLEKYVFPEKFRIRNGYLYFLFSGYNFNKKLMRVRIENCKI